MELNKRGMEMTLKKKIDKEFLKPKGGYKVTQKFFDGGRIWSTWEEVDEVKENTFKSNARCDVYETYFRTKQEAITLHKEAQIA